MKRPNFILFITDQQRADHVGAYGNPIVRTPNIDSLAARGWTADRFYVATPVCMPNRATLMTGRMPSVHGVRHNGIPLSLQAETFVELLRGAGYRTALVGKSHLQNMTGRPPAWPPKGVPRLPLEAVRSQGGRYDQEWGPFWRERPDHDVELPFYGFSDVVMAVDHGDMPGGHYWRWLEREHPEIAALAGPEHAIPTPGYELARVSQAWRTRVPVECYSTAFIGNETQRLLSECANTGEPFFIQCSFPDPHHPFTPPGKYWDMYRPEDVTLPASFKADASDALPHVAWLREQRDAGAAVKNLPVLFACTEREAREAIALNYGSISNIDESIGRVLQTLDQLNLADDTVVMFTSDHGDYFGDHQLLLKGPIHYQGIIRSPFIWRDPKGYGAGVRSAALCTTADIAPSVLARAEILPFNGIQGKSLVPLIQDRNVADWRDMVLIEDESQRGGLGFPSRTRLRTLQTQRYRLSVYDGADWGELYDLDNAPDELKNLWFDSGQAACKSELLHRLALAMIAHSETSPYPSAIA